MDRSTAPLEMFGEPDDTECPHGVPTGRGIECWECRYDRLARDYVALEDDYAALEQRVKELEERDEVWRNKKRILENDYALLLQKNDELEAALDLANKRLKSKADPLSQALNEGDGVYRP